MFEAPTLTTTDKPTLYRELVAQARALMADERGDKDMHTAASWFGLIEETS